MCSFLRSFRFSYLPRWRYSRLCHDFLKRAAHLCVDLPELSLERTRQINAPNNHHHVILSTCVIVHDMMCTADQLIER